LRRGRWRCWYCRYRGNQLSLLIMFLLLPLLLGRRC
jgi:hypothetical protein